MGDALLEALAELCRYTTARKGYRILMDALIPFIETYTENLDFSAAVVAARKGADITRKLGAVLGRASYVGKDNLQIEEAGMGVLDPGAVGVCSVLQGIGRALREFKGDNVVFICFGFVSYSTRG
ncbi:hypothetical protein ACHAP3_000684 [Botrytis cinerea]